MMAGGSGTMLFMVVERIMMMIVTVLTMMMMMTMMIMILMILLMVMLIMVQCSIVVAGAASGGNKVDRPAHPHTGRRMVMVMMMREREKVSESVRNGLVQILCLDIHCFGFQKSPPVEKVQRDTFTICGVRKREETFGSY